MTTMPPTASPPPSPRSRRRPRRRCSPTWPRATASSPTRPSACRWRRCRRWRSRSAATTRWPPRSGTPASTRRAWSPAWSTTRPQVTPEQMDRWRADFDNWAIVDTVCLQAVRPGAARLRQGRPVGQPQRRVRPPRRLRAARLAGAARPRRRRRLPRPPAADRGGRHRRAQLRQEGRQLGAARHRRQEDPGTAPGRARPRRPAAAVAGQDRPLDRQGRARAFAKADGR